MEIAQKARGREVRITRIVENWRAAVRELNPLGKNDGGVFLRMKVKGVFS